MAEADVGAGNVPIELDGKSFELKPSLAACMSISKLGGGGGMHTMVARCGALDFDAIHAVITAGLGLNPTQAKNLGEAIYKTGLMDLASPCIDFINMIANGGRPVEEGGDEDPPLGAGSPSP
jgi:hypothetical protein